MKKKKKGNQYLIIFNARKLSDNVLYDGASKYASIKFT